VKRNSLKIKTVAASSIFYHSGMRKGDIITAVNGEQIEDELDFRFFSADSYLEISYLRHEEKRDCSLLRPEGVPSGIEFYESPINRCRNRCIFCFIDQMPPGLRKGLYIKDEDVKHSFVNGNYVTMSSLTKSDLEKTVRLGISPLYISVHVTDHHLRNLMLGNRKAPPVLQQMKFLSEHGIMMHTQIVVCPGYNDGGVLKKTISDLLELGECICSIAVVPVGITRFRKETLRMVDAENARSIISMVTEISDQKKLVDGFRRLFCADELYIKAGLKIPVSRYYEDYPQIENGVGLIRMQLENWRGCRNQLRSGIRKFIKNRRVLLLSSFSAYTCISKIVSEITTLNPELEIDLVAVENRYFGTTVTVAGLLTAKDVLPVLSENAEKYDFGCLPSAMFNGSGSTLDGYSADRLARVSGMKIRYGEYIGDLFTTKKKLVDNECRSSNC
jgi:putative radical SAM enzyme (TIGR03279 family)